MKTNRADPRRQVRRLRETLNGRRLWVVAVWALAGCRCHPEGLIGEDAARLVANPAALSLAAVWVGQQTSGTVELTNVGGVLASVDLTIDAPFEVAPTHVELGKGATQTVTVRLVPSSAQTFSGVLRAEALEVSVDAEGLAVPGCPALDVCAPSRFDPDAGRCVTLQLADGTPCQGGCVTGLCLSGACHGQFSGCDDSDPCTVDSCSEADGCTHTPVVCPAPQNPCRIATCDSISGCGGQDVPDGTLCGPDDCTATEADVCLSGGAQSQCVRRPRPAQGRCRNTWVAAYLGERFGHAMDYDEVSGRLIAFGGMSMSGFSADTWAWDGTRWTQQFPLAAPPPRAEHAMAHDSVRHKLLLFGGFDSSVGLLADTWEWDGTTWVARTPASHPAARFAHAMAYDAARHRVVLFGGRGSTNALLADTWEWNGVDWAQPSLASSPPARAGGRLAYDAARGRVVLYGGLGSAGPLSDTWEWDGSTWSPRAPPTSPPARSKPALSYDPSRQRVVLFGGQGVVELLADTWEWDGATWTERLSASHPSARTAPAMAFDLARNRVVLMSGDYLKSDTWEWDGASWSERVSSRAHPDGQIAAAFDGARQDFVLLDTHQAWQWNAAGWLQLATSPTPQREGTAVAYDEARQRVVLFGGTIPWGTTGLSDTWEWDGVRWAERTPAVSPPARSGHALAYDSVRRRTVLFGGAGPADLWEWDGVSWIDATPAALPPARFGVAAAYDAAHRRVVFFGGTDALHSGPSSLTQTWTWDGTSWEQVVSAAAPPGRAGASMAYDSARQRVVLFGGHTWGGPSPQVDFSDTWEWDGANWTQLFPGTSPPRGAAALAYDLANQRLANFNSTVAWFYLP